MPQPRVVCFSPEIYNIFPFYMYVNLFIARKHVCVQLTCSNINLCGFITQLIKYHTVNVEISGSSLEKALKFFQALFFGIAFVTYKIQLR